MNKSKRHLKTVNEQILNKAEYVLRSFRYRRWKLSKGMKHVDRKK